MVAGLLALVFGFSTFRILEEVESSHVATAELHLATAIEFIEARTDAFFNDEAIRVSDWSSDGVIRDMTRRIAAGEQKLSRELGVYIKTKKIPLDPYVLISEVVAGDGTLLASTVEEPKDDQHGHLTLFDPDALSKLTFGQHAFSFPVLESHHGIELQVMAHFVVPLFALDDSSLRVGYLINHVRLDSFFESISGKTIKTTFGDPTLYLLDKNGMVHIPKEGAMLTEQEISEVVGSCSGSAPRGEAFIKQIEVEGKGSIIGAILCPKNGWWIPFLEADYSRVMNQYGEGRLGIAIALAFFFVAALFLYAATEYATSRHIGEIVSVLGDVAAGNLKRRVEGKSTFFKEITASINATIDSLERAHREEQELEKRLSSLDRVKNEFVSIAAHQIRTPISGILAATEVLGMETSGMPEKTARLVHTIRENMQKLNDFISFLLSATRAESGNAKFNLVSLSVKDLTQDVIASLEGEIEKRRVTIELSLSPDPLPEVFTDREVLRQVIQNFISNAVRYSHEGGTVKIRMTLKDRVVEYAVQDFGIGIPASVQNRIFGKFFRADNAKREVPEGTGLGLSFAKSLAESWGGSVWFESEEGKGSIFYVTIPIVGIPEARTKVIG